MAGAERRALVTGGAGFIGSTLARALVADGVSVVTVDKLGYAGNLGNLAALDRHPSHRFVKADITDACAMARIFAELRPSVIYHLAAESHVDRSIDGPMDAVASNVTGTAVLLDAALAHWHTLDGAAKAAFRFVHASTDEVFGDSGPQGRFDETSPYRPNSPYAATKAASDHLVKAWHVTYGLPTITANASNTYGPHQHPEKLIPHMILRALAGESLPLYGDGTQVRDWLHVDDHVAALKSLAAKGRAGERYAIGARNERQNVEVVRLICSALDKAVPAGAPHARLIAHVADRPGHDGRYALDPSKIERALGWRPAVAFDAGLEATIAWYLEHRDIWRDYDRARRGLGRKAS
jgi:dTDP-glucose 4,6-dehydratase